MSWFWALLRLVLAPLVQLCWRPRVLGLENVPTTGPALLASNHQSVADHLLTALPLRRQVFFVAKDQYVTGGGLRGLLGRLFFTALGIVPIDRSGGRAAEAALATGRRILGEGKLLGIYPEGTRAPDARLYRGKTGVARLALGARVPVVPVAVSGTLSILPEGSRLPRFGIRPTLRFGEPLDFSRYYDRAGEQAVRREVTDEVMRAIRELSGQEYVDSYAAAAKESAG